MNYVAQAVDAYATAKDAYEFAKGHKEFAEALVGGAQSIWNYQPTLHGTSATELAAFETAYQTVRDRATTARSAVPAAKMPRYPRLVKNKKPYRRRPGRATVLRRLGRYRPMVHVPRRLNFRTYNQIARLGERKFLGRQQVFSGVECAADLAAVKITMPSQGTTAVARIGDHIWEDRLQFVLKLRASDVASDAPHPTEATYPTIVRFLIVRWMEDDAATQPAIGDILDSGNWDNVEAPLIQVPADRARYQIVLDRTYKCPYQMASYWNGTAARHDRFAETIYDTGVLSLRKNHMFNSGALTGPGNYYCFLITNVDQAAATGPTGHLDVRFWFYG